MQKIGFIGLGNMGQGMVSNLVKAGYDVIVFDIDKKKVQALERIGAKKVDSLEKIGEFVERVILCLPHPKISKQVIRLLVKKRNLITTIIDTSTLTPEDAKRIFDSLQKKHIQFLCAPMLGGKDAAQNKQIHFLVEGEKNVFMQYKKLFLSMGKRADYMGEIPNATLAKLAYNICRYGNITIATEVALFLRSYTKNTKSIYNLLVEGSDDNFGQVWREDITEMILSGKIYRPSHIPEKDLALIQQLAKQQKLSGKLYKTIKEIYAAMR